MKSPFLRLTEEHRDGGVLIFLVNFLKICCILEYSFVIQCKIFVLAFVDVLAIYLQNKLVCEGPSLSLT